MPIATKTDLANLALDHLGEPYLTDYTTDVGTTADAVRLHLDQCVETVIEGHVWSFATRCATLASADVAASITLDPGGADNSMTFTAVDPGPDGNDITVEIAAASFAADGLPIVQVTGTDISVAPIEKATNTGGTTPNLTGFVLAHTAQSVATSIWDSGTTYPRLAASKAGAAGWLLGYYADSTEYPLSPSSAWDGDGAITAKPWEQSWVPSTLLTAGIGEPVFTESASTAQEVIDAVNGAASASALVTASASGTVTGVVAAVTATNLSGGFDETLIAPAWGSAFNLPADCLRVLKLDGADIDIPTNRFEIQGRYLLLEEADATAPVVHYLTNVPALTEWPTTFTDAVSFLLASRLAPKLSQDQRLANDFLQKHELALGKARSKDARETRSKENHGPRTLAARSGLVRARYATGAPRPPY